ncbi:MAG: hypothetical protein ACRDQC_13330 [Gaiellales bacterium]
MPLDRPERRERPRLDVGVAVRPGHGEGLLRVRVRLLVVGLQHQRLRDPAQHLGKCAARRQRPHQPLRLPEVLHGAAAPGRGAQFRPLGVEQCGAFRLTGELGLRERRRREGEPALGVTAVPRGVDRRLEHVGPVRADELRGARHPVPQLEHAFEQRQAIAVRRRVLRLGGGVPRGDEGAFCVERGVPVVGDGGRAAPAARRGPTSTRASAVTRSPNVVTSRVLPI